MIDDERQRFSHPDVELGEMPPIRMDDSPPPAPPSPPPTPAPKPPPKDEEPLG